MSIVSNFKFVINVIKIQHSVTWWEPVSTAALKVALIVYILIAVRFVIEIMKRDRGTVPAQMVFW